MTSANFNVKFVAYTMQFPSFTLQSTLRDWKV
jgi:hypothetical protein